MSTPWRLLNHRPSDIELPPLLISTTFTSNSYVVSLTDLTYLWSESLDRRAIIRRSLDEDTSIDPSEDAEQMRLFLEKIEAALSHGDKTSLSLRAFPPKDKHEPEGPLDLDLVITARLPKPLKALVWPIALKVAPQSALSSQLIVPILRAQNARLRELEMLVEVLRDKDHMIQKLVDKLEVTGAQLGHIFPGTVGKGGRKMLRRQAEQSVKGLGVFEVEEWRKEMRKREEEVGDGDVVGVVRDVFGDDGRFSGAKIANFEVSTPLDKWWERILKNDVVLRAHSESAEDQREKHGAASNKSKSLHVAREETEEDGFQVQATPPRKGKSPAIETNPASSPPTLRSQQVIDDSTEYEDHLDDLSQGSAIPDSYQPPSPKTQPKKLGTIGRPKPEANKASSPPPETRSQDTAAESTKDHPIVDDDETASEDEGDPPFPPKKLPTPRKRTATPPPATPQKGRLGTIGGTKKQESTPPAMPTPPAAHHLPERQPKHKLGVIGHKRATTAPDPDAPADDGEGDRGRARGAAAEEKEKEKEVPRETSRERADRKREELKRELELKAHVPVKKRRKF